MASSEEGLREALNRTAQALYEVQAELESQSREMDRVIRRSQEADAENMLLTGENRTLQRRIWTLERRHATQDNLYQQTKRALAASLKLLREEEAKRKKSRGGVVARRMSFWDFVPAQFKEGRAVCPEDKHLHSSHEEDEQAGEKETKGADCGRVEEKAESGTLASLLRRNKKRARYIY